MKYSKIWSESILHNGFGHTIDGNKNAKFQLDAFKKKCLMEGLDDIALSMEKISKIDNFEKKLETTKPWILNNGK